MADKLMIVAHPDDESLFGGASLIREKGWRVICVTNGRNKVRAKEFKKAMEHVGAAFEMWNYKDQWNGDFDRSALAKDLRRVLEGEKYTKIVTHSLSGEYGHTQHMALSQIMHSLVKNSLYTFKISEKPLDTLLLKKKKKLLRFYKSQNFKKFEKYMVFEGLEKVK